MLDSDSSPVELGLVPPDALQALEILLQAYEYAIDSGADRWQFAVEFSELLTNGLTRLDLRWLLCRRLIEHARETTIPGDSVRSFRALPFTSIPKYSCIVLTDLGSALLRSAQACPTPFAPLDSRPERPEASMSTTRRAQATGSRKTVSPVPRAPNDPKQAPRITPVWNPNLRELRYREKLVKKYCVPAANQELILAVFQEECWPEWIDDPLPPALDADPRRRLQATIKSLNRNQTVPLLRFHVNHGGQIVTWEESIP